MVKTLHFHGRGLRFSLWPGNYDPACCVAWPKRKKKKDVTLLNYFENYMRKQMQWAWLLKCGLFLINTE